MVSATVVVVDFFDKVDLDKDLKVEIEQDDSDSDSVKAMEVMEKGQVLHIF